MDAGETTKLLQHIRDEDGARQRVFEIVYGELRQLAGGMFRAQHASHTLQPTALVNEAFLRLVDQTAITWESRAHFFAVAARAMRQILVDHARRRHRLKRGGDGVRLTLHEAAAPLDDSPPELLDLDDALTKLEQLDPRQSQVVDLRFFGGLTVAEVALVMELSKTTVETEWRMASAWLKRELTRGDAEAG